MVLNEAEQKAAESFLEGFDPLLARQGAECFAHRQLGSVWIVRDLVRERLPFRRVQVELRFEAE